MHCRRPFWLHHKVEAEASTGPQLNTPAPDILVSMSTGTPHHAGKMPKQATRACPSPDACCTHWTVQLSLNLLGSGLLTIVTPLRSWISHGQLDSLFCPAIACLLQGHGRPGHLSALKLWRTFGRHEAALLGWAVPPLDNRLCTWCGQIGTRR